ncbi:MAG: recombination mediator RecR [Nitrospinota bacterium]|nr:recombination mediator RecR [Nitrospinota bacterium]
MKGLESVNNLVKEFKRLPGIGQKTAERLAFFVLKSDKSMALALAEAMISVKESVRLCSVCNSITEDDHCEICRDSGRDRDIICVVEESKDIYAIERSREFKGLYHVLMGVLAPLDGIGPSNLKIKELELRISGGGIKEVIIATNPDTEGEATSIYLSKVLKPLGVKVSRIARGLPVGSDLEYADEVTIMRSLQGRKEI